MFMEAGDSSKIYKATGKFYVTEGGWISAALLVNNGDPSGEGVVVMTDAFALLDYTVFHVREEMGNLFQGVACWLYGFCLDQLPHLSAVQGWVSVSRRRQQWPLEGDADLTDEQHHSFSIL